MSAIRRSDIIKNDIKEVDISKYPNEIQQAIKRKYPARYYQIFQNIIFGWKRCYNEENNNVGIKIRRVGTTPMYQIYVKEDQRNHNAVIGYYCVQPGCVQPQFDIVLNGIEQPIGYISGQLCLSFCPDHTTNEMRMHHSNNFNVFLRGKYINAIIKWKDEINKRNNN